MASPALVVGMQDNEYTDAQVGDAGGLFKSLDPAPCGAVPAYLTQCASSSLPHPVLQFQSTSSSAAVPVYFIQCCSSSLPHLVLQFQSTSSSAPVPCSLPHQSRRLLISCSLFLFLYFFSFKFRFIWIIIIILQ